MRLHPFFLLLMGVFSFSLPAFAASKYTMPDFAQVDNTCFPTAAADLIAWFGENGYPNLLPREKDQKISEDNLVKRLMIGCGTTFAKGTDFKSIAGGLEKYITSNGYHTSVIYRGMGSREDLELDWLKNNDKENEGFILYLAFFLKEKNFKTLGAHAVTLLNYNDGTMAIHDPAHFKMESGRRVLHVEILPEKAIQGEMEPLKGGHYFQLTGFPDHQDQYVVAVLLGAICIEMKP